jgi:hypothetical protein
MKAHLQGAMTHFGRTQINPHGRFFSRYEKWQGRRNHRRQAAMEHCSTAVVYILHHRNVCLEAFDDVR